MAKDAAPSTGGQSASLEYPQTRRVDQRDNYHGTVVDDPYRWLEEDVRESSEVAEWVAAQQKMTDRYLESLPQRKEIEERLTKLWNFARYSPPSKAGERYLYRKNDGLQNQSVLYLADRYDADGKVLIDPNTWSDDGTIALGGYSTSHDGHWLAYQKSEAGSDWRTMEIMDLTTGEVIKDRLQWLKFTGASWSHDDRGFYYSRYPQPKEGAAFQSAALNRKVYFHKLGTPQSADVLIYEDPEHDDWTFSVSETDDGRWQTLEIREGTDAQNQLWIRRTGDNAAAWTPLSKTFDHFFTVIASEGDDLLLLTDLEASKRRVIRVPATADGIEKLTEVVPESESTLEEIDHVGGKLITQYLEDVAAKVKVFALDGTLETEVPLPGLGSVSGFGGKATDQETFFSYASYDTPPSSYHYDLKTGKVTLLRRPEMDFNPEDYVVKREFYTSPDGTRAPIFLAHKKDLERNHKNPTLLYGYGGFSISVTPRFSVSRLAWMELGGVVAVATLRGGGEYGEDWHQAGKLDQKQNVFDDFIAAGEWLIASGYTEPKRLAVQGRSNGGLLVGAVMTQRPDLFGACLPGVGVMDMLRFHKFTAGQFWRDEYGSADEPDQFPALMAYSPYHNVKPGTNYPATLVTTADTDDRVVPMHSFKFAAALQAANPNGEPMLIDIESRAGHGAGTPTTKLIEQAADEWAFLLKHLQ